MHIILEIYRDRGNAQYGGEAVSQLEHALQCAALAEQAGQSAELIAACLLHDFGHLVHRLGEGVTARGIDDRHEYRAIPILEKRFPTAVTAPIRLHVAAKRYLCAIDPSYWNALSPASKRSLELQGGIFSDAAAAQFIQQPYAPEAIQLRRWDDLAKIPNLPTPDLSHFTTVLQEAAIV
ncbi:HD domain-containing protein [Oscillatoria sp. CS-180]|uniref:phosphonate degradation HD-domain oxygenase n=1 Tax=Oscillatoria sp. CS-180 TaxID=3021720 RepID=UPI00232A95F3|nr:phosphonate degradation HD-domain oxygenase [Oscillatoria sp. CS-180]MDB9529035.1 HD domain-containing protein [Oscillatoria sp. CS-180]